MRKIPHRVMAFFQDDSITLVGNNIDLKQISRYYPEMDSVIKNREEKNIVSLGGLEARKRDVVYSGTVSSPILVKRTLGYILPKDDQDIFSDWNVQRPNLQKTNKICHTRCRWMPSVTLKCMRS